MTTFSAQHRRQLSQTLAVLALAVLLVQTGSWVAKAPVKAWAVLVAAAGLLLFRVDPVYWMTGALLTATLSRLAEAVSGPHFLDFVHFPLVIGGLAATLLKGATSSLGKLLGAGLLLFLFVNFLSWGLNSGELLRPLMNSLIFAEPFVLIYVLLVAPPSEGMAGRLWKLILGIALLQVPLGVWQWTHLARGNPDLVQGSFIGSGTGAHVAGGVALLGAMIAICRGSTSRSFGTKAGLFALVVPLFALSVLADAKQAIFCFLPGVLWAIVTATRVHPLKLALPILFMAGIFYAAYNLYAPLRMIASRGLISEGSQGKLNGLTAITAKFSRQPYSWLFGFGPGNTVSRLALLTPDVYLSDKSTIRLLGLKTSPITRELIGNGDSVFGSSAFGGEASWFGLLGDLGAAGVLVYLWMVRVLWADLSRARNWQSASAKGGIIMMGLLGGIYDWLEEPGFTLVVATMTGLALAASAQRNRPTSPAPRRLLFTRRLPASVSR